MRRSIARMRGLGFILWQTRHELFHVLLGLVWAWFLRERWNKFNGWWVLVAVFGSLLPDLDHIVYFFTYGRHDWYTKEVKQFFRRREWRAGFYFLAHGHKLNTNLAFHNYYTIGFLLLLSFISSLYEWHLSITFFGAMLTHYFFDIIDDFIFQGYINPNWKRLGRPKVR